jgi:hypothetical protein
MAEQLVTETLFNPPSVTKKPVLLIVCGTSMEIGANVASRVVVVYKQGQEASKLTPQIMEQNAPELV